MLTQSEETKLTNPASASEWDLYCKKNNLLHVVCENCGKPATVEDRTLKSVPCRNCEMEIDLK